MKSILLLLFMLFSASALAQNSGIVLDRQTGLPIAHATIVQEGVTRAQTDSSGKFRIFFGLFQDSVFVFATGYQLRRMFIRNLGIGDSLTIYLQPLSSVLDEVVIRFRIHKQDSIDIRQQFAKQFNYTGPKIKDVFSQYKSPYDPPSISIGVVTLVGMLTKKTSKDYKLQQKLLNYESENYVDYKFSEELVARVTQLQGDSLAAFMRQYRPTKAFLQTATQYELMRYIKTNCTKYRGHE